MQDLTILNDLIYTCGGLLDSGGNQLFGQYGLTVKMYAILNILGDGPRTNGELADVVRGSPSSVAQKMALLVERGLVVRSVDDTDRRVRHFDITDKGRELLAQIHPSYQTAMLTLYEGVEDDDAQTAIRVLRQLLHNLVNIKQIRPPSGI